MRDVVVRNAEHWDEELLAWFCAWESWPREPFELYPGVKAADPGRFLGTLVDEVALGPTGARARLGATMKDLSRLRELFG